MNDISQQLIRQGYQHLQDVFQLWDVFLLLNEFLQISVRHAQLEEYERLREEVEVGVGMEEVMQGVAGWTETEDVWGRVLNFLSQGRHEQH